MDISPMLLTEVDDKSVLDKPWIFERKWNGVRAIIHVKDHKIVGIRNRSNNPILYCFPEFSDIRFGFNSAILDGEIVVLKDGREKFYDGVDRRRSLPTTKVLKDYPATIVVFDIIQLEAEPLVYRPYHERLHLIEHGILPTEKVKVIESSHDGKALWECAVSEDWEGVVAKDPLGLYEIGARSKSQIKFKNYKYVDIVVEQVEPNAKGTKIYSHTQIRGVDIVVEAQQAGAFSINVGDTIRVKYLDIVGDHMVQPTRY